LGKRLRLSVPLPSPSEVVTTKSAAAAKAERVTQETSDSHFTLKVNGAVTLSGYSQADIRMTWNLTLIYIYWQYLRARSSLIQLHHARPNALLPKCCSWCAERPEMSSTFPCW